MSTFEQIATEYTHGTIGPVEYGAKVRVVMRSPDRLLFVGYGLNLAHRSRTREMPRKLAHKSRVTLLDRVDVRQRITEAFGEGADEWVRKALSTRGRGTILVDGGGEPMPPTRAELKEAITQAYSNVTPSRKIAIEGLKTCHQCGCDLPIRTHNVILPFPNDHDNHDRPSSIDECQRRSNHRVVSVTGYDISKPQEWWPLIEYYSTWDGESYEKELFCSHVCAAAYGRRAVEQGFVLDPQT